MHPQSSGLKKWISGFIAVVFQVSQMVLPVFAEPTENQISRTIPTLTLTQYQTNTQTSTNKGIGNRTLPDSLSPDTRTISRAPEIKSTLNKTQSANPSRIIPSRSTAVATPKPVMATPPAIVIKNNQPTAPEGWTRATSNANFAFQYAQESGTYGATILQVMDLKTETVKNIASYVSYFDRYAAFAGTPDIDPTGTYVTYLLIHPNDSPVTVKKLSDLSAVAAPVFGDGKLTEGVWTDSTYTFRWTANYESDNAPKSGIYKIDLKTGKVTSDPLPIPQSWTRATSNANFAFQYAQESGTFGATILRVMDLKTGTVKNIASYVGYVDRYVSFSKDSDVDPTGTYVTFSMIRSGGTYVTVSKLTDGKVIATQIVNEGTLSKSTWTSTAWRFQWNPVVESPDSKTGIYTVDLTSGKVSFETLPVPNGWTRAASHSNYVFRITDLPGAPSLNGVGLQVMNLSTGEIKTVASYTPYFDRYVSFSNYADVDSTGTVVAFSMLRSSGTYLTISKLADAKIIATLILDEGMISYSNWTSIIVADPIAKTQTREPYFWTFQWNSKDQSVSLKTGVYKVDLRNGQVTFQNLPVPQGWTRATGNSNYAYKTETEFIVNHDYYVLKLQNLATGEIKVLGQHFAGIGYYFSSVVVSPNGLAAGINSGTLNDSTHISSEIVKISDPSKRISFSNGKVISLEVVDANTLRTQVAINVQHGPTSIPTEVKKWVTIDTQTFKVTKEEPIVEIQTSIVGSGTERKLQAQMSLAVAGTYVLESSTDLKNWTAVETYEISQPSVKDYQTDLAGPSRYFRVRYIDAPVIPPVNTTSLSVLPGTPAVTAVHSISGNGLNEGKAEVSQSSSNGFSLKYELTKPASFGGAVIGFSKSTDLSHLSAITLAAKLNVVCSGKCGSIQLIDENREQVSISLSNLSSQFQTSTILTSAISKVNSRFNLARVTAISFVVTHQSPVPNGVLDVQISGLQYIPRVGMIPTLARKPVVSSSPTLK